jgi:hypothetical protein
MTQLPAAYLELDPEYAVRSYFKDPDWMFKTGMGGILNAIALLIAGMMGQSQWWIPVAMAVSALVNGYLLRVAKKRQDDPRENLPEWNAWGELLFGGLTWMAIQFSWHVMAAIPITIALIMGVVGVSAYAGNATVVAILLATLLFVLLFVGLFTHFLLSYLMLNFARVEKLSAGFNFGRVIIYFIRYPKQMLAAWILSFELQFFAVLLPSATVIGIPIVPSTLFAAQLVSLTIMAQVWNSAVAAEQVERELVAKKED